MTRTTLAGGSQPPDRQYRSRCLMPRGVLDVSRDGAGAGPRCPPALARNVALAFLALTVAFVVGCVLAHELIIHGHPGAFALFPTVGALYLLASVPLAVVYTNPSDVRAGLNPLVPSDYAWLFRRTYSAFASSTDGKVRGKDL